MLGQGEVFAGYTVERLLGQGGMGSVYLARHPRTGKRTALKLLSPDLFTDQKVRARFEREADLAAQLDHPGIIAVYDRGSENGQLWISMQYVDGVDAASVDVRTLPPERAVQIVEGVAEALDYAHGRGVLHRDVKPANILLARAGTGKGERVFLSDFGIARLREDTTHLTQTGMFTATLAYASPEQMTGAPLGNRSDQYSLACALYWLLTGVGPFDADNPADIIHGHLNLAAVPVSHRRPGLNPAMDLVVAAGMAKLPEHRYRTCAEFAAAARAALTASGPPPLPAPVYPRPPVVAQPHPGYPPAVAPAVPPGVPGPRVVQYQVPPPAQVPIQSPPMPQVPGQAAPGVPHPAQPVPGPGGHQPVAHPAGRSHQPAVAAVVPSPEQLPQAAAPSAIVPGQAHQAPAGPAVAGQAEQPAAGRGAVGEVQQTVEPTESPRAAAGCDARTVDHGAVPGRASGSPGGERAGAEAGSPDRAATAGAVSLVKSGAKADADRCAVATGTDAATSAGGAATADAGTDANEQAGSDEPRARAESGTAAGTPVADDAGGVAVSSQGDPGAAFVAPDSPPPPPPVAPAFDPAAPPPGGYVPPQTQQAYPPNPAAPPRRSFGTALLVAPLILGVVAVLALAVGVFVVVQLRTDPAATSEPEAAAAPTTTESRAVTSDPFMASRKAFPRLLPQGSVTEGPGHGDTTCFAHRRGDTLRIGEPVLADGPWLVAWECLASAGSERSMDYVILQYESPRVVADVLDRLPPSVESEGRKDGEQVTQRLWVQAAAGQVLRHTANLAVAFPAESPRGAYLLYATHTGASRHPLAPLPSADEQLAAWWEDAPV